MFQHSKAHSQTPLLSLLINPVVRNPPHTSLSALLYSQILSLPSFLSFCPAPSLFCLSLWMPRQPPTTGLAKIYREDRRRAKDERMRADGGVGVYVFVLSVYVCVLLFDQCWRILTSFMCIKLSHFPFLLSPLSALSSSFFFSASVFIYNPVLCSYLSC